MEKSIPVVVHIFGQTPHHYIPMQTFFNKVAKGIQLTQEFWAFSHIEHKKVDGIVFYENASELIEKMKAQNMDTKFIFHGLLDRQVWPRLAFSSLVKNCSWVCWGAELYQHKKKRKKVKQRIAKLLHQNLVFRFENVFSLNDGDGRLIQQLLSNVPVKTLPYPLISDNDRLTQSEKSGVVRILVGNSAAISNEHIDALNWLARFNKDNMTLIVPLNYAGSPEYVGKVIKVGNSLFGDKFIPIKKMLSKKEYDELLSSVDICFFAHKRQQGLYVVYSMFKNGKKVFLRENTTSYEELRKQGFTISSSSELTNLSFQSFAFQSQRSAQLNAQLMRTTFSEEALLPKWKAMLLNIASV